MKKNTSASTILLTGAGKGIGAAIASEFSRRAKEIESFGAIRLFLVSRTVADLDRIKDQISHDRCEIETLAIDLSSGSSAKKTYETCLKKWGTPHCLINNAGVGRFADFLELSEEDYDYTMNTNLRGAFFLTQRAFESMKERHSGHMIFVTSVAAETPFEQSSLYCMSKFGQKGLVEVMRLYGRKYGIRVTNIMPGAVQTPMWGEVDSSMSKRMMQPEDIARVVADSYCMPERTSIEEIVIRPIAGDL